MKRAAKSSKSREGCSRCKSKKIKCDETRPACQACQRAGVECPGFAFQYRWSRKHEKIGSCRNEDDGQGEASVSMDAPASRSIASSQEHQACHEEEAAGPRSLSLDGFLSSNHQVSDQLAIERLHPADHGPFQSRVNAPTAPRPDLYTLSGFGRVFPGAENTILNGSTEAVVSPATGFRKQVQLDDQPAQGHIRGECHESQGGEKGACARRASISTKRRASEGRNLLELFYRLSTEPATPKFSDEHVVHHFFTTVAPLLSCFGSRFNPFRTLVQEFRPFSKTVHLAVLSLATAHLAHEYPCMELEGQVKHRQASESLHIDLQSHRSGDVPSEQTMTSLLLLGASSTRQQPSDPGLQYLSMARDLMQDYLRGECTLHEPSKLREEVFFVDALLYWEMLASFIVPTLDTTLPAPCLPIPAHRGKEQPRPCTGITTEVCFALGEIGRLMRRRRCNKASDSDDQWASSLERYIHTIVIPSESSILDYGDDATPKIDLLRIADASRYVALLELYLCFPKLFQAKLAEGPLFPECSDDGRFCPDVVSASAPNQDRHRACLCALAEFAMGLIREIPTRPGVCRMQLLILVSCASQLQSPAAMRDDVQHKEINDSRSWSRFFVEERLNEISQKYSRSQVMQLLHIVKEVWKRLDHGSADNAHWLDVMHEKGLQTLVG